jgi:periplasmic protein TonB
VTEGFRWVACAAIVAAAHVLGWLYFSSLTITVETDPGAPEVTLALSPVIAAPAQSAEESNATQNASGMESAGATLNEPLPEKGDAPNPESTAEPPAPPLNSPPTVQPHGDDLISAPMSSDAAPPPKLADKAPPAPLGASFSTSAAFDALETPDTMLGHEAPAGAALSAWRKALVAQIERSKRFPPEAIGQSGVSKVEFSIERTGHVTRLRLLASSGSAALDDASLELVRRAQPFPPPPAGLADSELTFVVPIRFHSPRR